MLSAAAIMEHDGHRCTWMNNHRRCPATSGLRVHPATTPDNQDRTLCERHERELQAHERERASTPSRLKATPAA
jgi:hypothetical protein